MIQGNIAVRSFALKALILAPIALFLSLSALAFAAPSITSLLPTSGAVGASVTITGTNFGATQGTSTVKFNGTAATVTTWSASSIVTKVPFGATTGNVVITVSSTASNGKSFTVVSAPAVSSLSPTSGPVGVSVTIAGSNFGSSQGSSTVTFNGMVASITSWGASSIVAKVPSGATSGNVVVHAAGVDSNGVSFAVLPTPNITNLSPASGMIGDSVNITGTNFGASQGTSTVKFNGTVATPTSWSNSSIVVPVPAGASTGNVVVTVSGVASAGVSFTAFVTPSITSLSPSSGAVGAAVTITGTNFQPSQGSSTVTFNGTAATPTSWTATQVKTVVPSGATTGSVVITVAGLVSNGKSFTVRQTPSITSLSPTVGAVGMLVSIAGANFGTTQGSSTVKFNGVAATATKWSDTQITATVPSGATTGNLVVHVSGVDTNGASFAVATVTSISVTPQNLSLPLHSVQQFTAVATYSNGSIQSLASNATWSSSDISLETIDAAGMLTAVGQGQVTIQAAFGSVTGSTTVTVTGSRFFPTGTPGIARSGHTATLLQNGKVLIVGGQALSHNRTELASAELYDPTTHTFTPTGNLRTARVSHTATLLQNGRVLIAGGEVYVPGFAAYNTLASAELYDPATGTFIPAANMNNPHKEHTSTALDNGMVLIAGGVHQTPDLVSGLSITELYDPATDTFTITGPQITPRVGHTATKVADGTVLLAGGGGTEGFLNSAEIFDPATGTFTATGSLQIAKEGHTATLLNSGMVLVTGGSCSSDCSAEGELYDPVSKVFTVVGNLNLGRLSHTATPLHDGTALIIGGGQATITGTAEVFDPLNRAFTGNGSLTDPRMGHTATLLNDGTVLIVGGFDFHGEIERAEIYSPVPPAPYSLQITPAAVNMQVGDTRQFSAVDNLGNPRSDATWTVSDSSLATITADGQPLLTAIAAGQVTVTASVEGVSAQELITVSPAGPVVPGAVLWSMPSLPGFSSLQLAQAVPTDSGPGLYSIQVSGDGKQSMVQALSADGQQMWQKTVPAANGNSVPDAFGGLIVTEYNTCNPGQTDPMTIEDLDATTGRTLWRITAQPSPGLYCFPEAPQMAIRGDGSVFITTAGNTSGLPEIMVVDGHSGAVITAGSPPASTYTNPNGSTFTGYSRIGPPIVNSDGWVAYEYEVRQVAYPPRVVSSTLYLEQVSPDNFTGINTQLTSTTSDENLLPGRIIPDGQGGVIATWTVSPSNPPVPVHPYQAAHVVAGAVTATYDLPFSPTTVTYGKYPTLVLGENGTAFATDGTDTANGPRVVSFDLNSGAIKWSYTTPAQDTITMLASTTDGGIAISDSQTGIIHLDTSGLSSQVNGNPGGVAQYSWTGQWSVQSLEGTASLILPIEVDPAGLWATPKGSASQNGSGVPLCPCITESAPSTASSLASLPNLGLSRSSGSPLQPATGTPTIYVQLVGDPGINTSSNCAQDPEHCHNVGQLFDFAASTQSDSLTASNSNVVITRRISSVQDFNTGLTANGTINGGVSYFGHGAQMARSDGSVLSLLAAGQGAGVDTNISALNVSTLSNAQLSATATLTLNACNAGLPPIRGGGHSIAQLIANQLQRKVYAWKIGMFFSQDPSARFPKKPDPNVKPLYMIPLGGSSITPCTFTPNQAEPQHCGGQ